MTDQERPATLRRDDPDNTYTTRGTTVNVYDRPNVPVRQAAGGMSTLLLLIVLALVAYLVYRLVF